MAQIPYQPMHSPQKQVTQEDMWETLKRHLPPGSSLEMKGSETQSPKEKPAVARLKWCEPVETGEGAGYVLSQCGRFSIEFRQVHKARMYMAWRRQIPSHNSVSLGIRTTSKEAVRLCKLEAAREP